MQAQETELDLAVDDLGPLAWMLEELGKSLEAAFAAQRRWLREAAAGSTDGAPDTSQLRIARQQLHQGLGALEMVGLRAPAQMLRAMEAALVRFIDRPDTCNEAALTEVERAGRALLEFLDALLNGRRVSAVSLFAQYRRVGELARLERLHPADLWSRDWSWREPATPAAPQAAPYAPVVRTRMDQAVLRIVKSGDAAAARELSRISLALAQGQQQPRQRQARIFWKICAGFFEALWLQLLEADVYAKRAASRVLVQYAQLAKGDEVVGERLAHDLLFFCAQARVDDPAAAPVLAAVRAAWNMQRHSAVDYTSEQFGRFDPALLAQSRKRIASAKEIWSLLAGGEPVKLGSVAEPFRQLGDTLARLHPQTAPLAVALQAVGDAVARGTGLPGAELAMEVATALLYVEAAFQELDPTDTQLPVRVARLAERLDAALAGGHTSALEPWMEELYRRVSDRQTMGSVVGELRVALAELEKDLDAYFRDPSDRKPLQAVPAKLGQMRGVLSVLGLDHAAQAAQRMRDAVETVMLAQGEAELAHARASFDALGNNVGALGFLIDMLNYQPALARKLFVWDEAAGELRPVMGRTAAGDASADFLPDVVLDADAPAPLPDLERPAAAAAPELPQAPVVDLAPKPVSEAPGAVEMAQPPQLPDIPDVPQLPELPQLAELQEPPRLPSAVLAQVPQEVPQEVPAELPSEVPPMPPLPEVDAQAAFTAAAPVPSAPVAAMPAQPSEEDAELRGIFLDEAREVVGNGLEAVSALAREPADLSQLTILRRAFHTLKGSSRMVGLTEFGEAGWAMEQVLNEWLAENHPASADLRTLAQAALQGFGRWVDDVAGGTDAAWTGAMFRGPADAFRNLRQLQAFAFPQADAPAPVDEPTEVEALPEPATPAPETAEAADVFAQAPPLPAVEVVELDESFVAQPLEEPAAVDAAASAAPAVEEDAQTAPALDIADAEDPFGSHAAIEVIELGEAPQDASAADAEAVSAPLIEPVAIESATEMPAEMAAEDLSDAAAIAADAPLALAAPEGVFEIDFGELSAAPPVQDAQPQEAAAEDTSEQGEDPVRVIGSLRIGIALFNVFLNEADEWSRRLQMELAEWSMQPAQRLPESTAALAHSLAGSSATVGFHALSAIARQLEHSLARTHQQGWAAVQHGTAYNDAAEEIRWLLHQFAAGFLKEPDARIPAALAALDEVERPQPPAAQPAAPASDAPQAPSEPPVEVQDVIDADLFTIFEDEALELLPQIGGALRDWAARPHEREPRDAVLRGLHTLKGSARLAGAMRLGELAHRLESQIELLGADDLSTADIEPLLHRSDALQIEFDAVRARPGRETIEPAAPALPAIEALAGELAPPPIEAGPPQVPESLDAAAAPLVSEEASPSVPGEPPATANDAQPAPTRAPFAAPISGVIAPPRAAAGQAVRVRSQLLDKLVNQAGEVMISRTRLENELRQLRGSIADLTGNVDRLRAQLRELEMQADTQMQSRLAHSKDAAGNFDPLEFDRYTRVQELTRMMAESVNDISTVQRNLQRTVDATEDDLAAQARQTRELQRDLLRTRMVEFDSIADRMYRVVRQASKDAERQVRLDIEHGGIELDRGVLERMTPAFEHLLRNCVAHGIEDPQQREAAGKDATGSIRIVLAHEGNDVSVEFVDDGGGLDLERIRERAVQQGLLAEHQAVGEAEAANLIFMPGFTTAASVTELSGRGIGMDVVRSEVNALGGRIETRTTPGHGTSFKLVLPLTTAVTQVVMVRSGALSFGVPANLVEVVRRAGAAEVQSALAGGRFVHEGGPVPFYWSGALLQASRRSTEEQQRNLPVVVFRSAAQRVAVQVDEVLGNQEVVVKNLGPQLSRLPGLAGMAVLPSGAVVLIYNPVALAAVYGEQARSLSTEHGQPVEIGRAGLPGGSSDADSRIPLVLVVDDSITVRRVTQRLLQRDGWRVALAADGLQALEKLAEETPAVILSDIEMPRMDGFDFVRNLRADARWRELPVIMITSRIAEKHRELARQLGVDHYLGKPYAEDELLGLVRDYCAQAVADDAAGPPG